MRAPWIALGVVGLAVIASLVWVAQRGPASEAAPRAPDPSRSVPDDSLAMRSPALAIPPASADDERSVIAVQPAEVDATSQQALLVVHALSKDSKAPLSDVRISVWPYPSESGFSLERTERSSADFGASLLTDSAGRADVHVPPGRSFVVTAQCDRDLSSHAKQNIEQLAPGETREIELLISSDSNLRFVGRAVADESGAPLPEAWVSTGGVEDLIRMPAAESQPNAAARVSRSSSAHFQVEPDGSFELDARSSEDEAVRIDAPGREWKLVALVAGHETRDQPLEIRIRRSAAIEVIALGAGHAPLQGARVRLSADSYRVTQAATSNRILSLEDLRWETRTEVDGRARLEGLPPEVPFRLEAALPGEADYRIIAEGQPLEAGELRKLEVLLGGGATVSGRMQRSDGKPIAGWEIWMRPWTGRWSASFRSYDKEGVRTASTREDGVFAFEEVPDGEWVLAPKPEGKYAAEPQRATVLGGVADQEILLTAYDDLFIRGTVVDATGAPTQAFVIAFGTSSPALESTQSDDGGRFSIGPFAPGAYQMQAQVLGETQSRSALLEVQAGATDVLLRLQVGCRLRGRVVDAAGNGVAAQITVAPRRSADEHRFGGTIGSCDSDGAFDFHGLDPGVYCLAASTSAGACGIAADLTLEDGAGIDDLVVRVQPGGHLRLRYDGPDEVAQFRVYCGATVVAMDGVERGASATWVVPTGTLHVLCTEHSDSGSITREQDVTVALGALSEVRFGVNQPPR